MASKLLNRIKLRFKMNRAYMRRCEDGENFKLTFEYANDVDKPHKTFNFCRNLNESIETFKARISTNMQKANNKKKKEENGGKIISFVSNDVEIGGDVKCCDIFSTQNNVSLSIDNRLYKIVVNSPWVESIDLPKSILANFYTYPSKFQAVNTQIDLSDFIWYKSKDKVLWEKLSNSFIYTPTNNDIEHYLKLTCSPRNELETGPSVEVITPSTVQSGPVRYPFQKRHVFTSKKTQKKEFRVISYNILADLYCSSDTASEVLFPYCPKHALDIEYRKQLFIKEIIGYKGDLICLQEVDSKIFKHDLNPILSQLGYEGDICLKGGQVAEGLAFFYNKNKFQLLQSERVIFAEIIDKDPIFVDIWSKIEPNKKLAERFKDRTTVLQLNVVSSREGNEILVVANTHLYFHPDADHIRLLQGCVAVRYLEHFTGQLRQQHGDSRVSLIFCGDFNSVPSCGIYKLYTTGSIPGNFIDYRSNEEEAIENVDVAISIRLESACGTPKYTNFTAGFADCLDYIFFQENNLAVTQMVPLPSHEELIENTALPSEVFPSDHVCLVADLRWL